MPFIAIAAIIALFVGGGVTVAADQAKPGDALYQYKVEINDQARRGYHEIKSSLGIEATVDADASANAKRAHLDSDDSATTSLSDIPTANGALRVRADASDAAKAADDRAEGSGAVNADGSINVNVY